MVAVLGTLLFLAVLVFATVRFVQWLRGTGPFDRDPRLDPEVDEARRALRDDLARGRPQDDDPPTATRDLNDAWMTGEAFGPPDDGGDGRRR